MRRSTRWTSGRALCRTLRRWFPFSFFSLFLSLLLLLFFFSAFSSILVSRPLESSPFGSVITATLYRFFLSLGTGLVCRSSGPTWRTRRHFTRRRDERRRETWRESRFSTASNFSLNRGIVAKGSIGGGLDRCEGRQYKKACIDIFPMPRHSRGEIMRLTAAEGRGGDVFKANK